MFRILKYLLLLVLVQSCATKKYVNKKQLKGTISNLTESKYIIKNNSKQLVEKTIIQLTNNGRIKYAETADANNNIIETVEKKLFFNKKSFPEKEAHYCKTRWKPNQRERISCYTQKQYKENEIIVHYNKNGTIDKTVDNFSDFSTKKYYYNTKTNNLETILVKNKNGEKLNEISYKCLKKDTVGNCITLEKSFSNSVNKMLILRDFNYQ